MFLGVCEKKQFVVACESWWFPALMAESQSDVKGIYRICCVGIFLSLLCWLALTVDTSLAAIRRQFEGVQM